ncbi:MAG: phosphotransferase, partial [Deltaproteobacteria bacterium]
MSADASAPEMEWDELAPGGEISATVLMMSGFVLPEGQRVRERYLVQGQLGEGAMGQVLAVKLVGSADEQTYALKVVARPIDANDDGVIDEAEAAEARRAAEWFAQLLREEAAKQDQVQRHGVSVARLFTLVQLDDGSIGLRMELARGRSLDAWIEERKEGADQPPELMWAVQVVRKLVSQLRRLHEMAETGSPFGFVHSDIKPGNVFVDDKDSSDIQITLLDFGVATAGHALAQDMSMRGVSRKTFILQQTGGTIGYAPPMHFTSKATPLSDVFASL